ncbi:hypothetical protein HDU67_009419 [Dinochytrium kinnereticum]|nr:hypothetical protein HDU67_009419 [Dinochytrium kinnereticum]
MMDDAPMADDGLAGGDITTSIDIFAKERSLQRSGIPAQRKIHALLLAVEHTIVEQKEEITPLAYFGALMTLLEQQAQATEDSGVEDIVVAIVHLLAVVFSRIPSNILRFKFHEIATTVGATLQDHSSSTPIVRDALSCVEYLLVAQDASSWNAAFNIGSLPPKSSELRALFQIVLLSAIDERPKIRKRGQDSLKRLLTRPPPPSLHHPATIHVIDYCSGLINAFLNRDSAGKGDAKTKETQVLHVLVLLKTILPALAMQGGHAKTRSRLSLLCTGLLKLPTLSSGTGNTVVTQWVFQVLEALFSATSKSKDGSFPHLDIALVDSVVRSLLSIRPFENDVTLSSAWLDLVSRGLVCLTSLMADGTSFSDVEKGKYAATVYPVLLETFWSSSFTTMMGAQKQIVVQKAGEAFSFVLKNAIPEAMLESSLRSRKASDPLREIISSIQKMLGNPIMRDAWGAVLVVSEAAFARFGFEGPALVDDLLSFIITIRDAPNYSDEFPFIAQVESCLQTAALSMGLERFTLRAPFNLFDVDDEKEARRPYLLSIFYQGLSRYEKKPDQPFGAPNLAFFTLTLIPLANRLVERAVELKGKGHNHPSKLFETLALQIYKLFPVLCEMLPSDLADVFDKLAPRLGKTLQAVPDESGLPDLVTEIKPLIYQGLTSLITGYHEVMSLDNEVEENLEHLEIARAGLQKVKNTSNKFLNTLCNQYTFVDPASLEVNSNKGSLLQSLHDKGNAILEACIGAFLLVAEGGAITSYFYSLVKSLLQHQASDDLAEEALFRHRSYLVIDLVLVMLPFLPDAVRVQQALASEEEEEITLPSESALFVLYKVLIGQLRDGDATLQKKTYKGLNLLVDLIPLSQLSLPDLISKLLDSEVMSLATSGVKRLRVKLLQRIVEIIPQLDGHEKILIEFVPVALSEVILATKEASEKARTAAFECLVGMGRQMHSVGIRIQREKEWEATRRKLDGKEDDGDDMDEESVGRVCLKEFFVMVSAGLAGESAHMQSAAINCLSRLIFEFSDALDADLIKELVSTNLLFISSNNREIIKAVLGFVKVAIVALPQEYLEDELENIATSILMHSREHRSHFKSKVRHIFERLIRRFSLEAVQGFVPESDSRLITNIRKRRERLKKKKAQERNGDKSDTDDEDPRVAALKKKQQMQSRQREFEDALHGSESELESDNDDDDDKYIPEQLRFAAKKTQKGPSSGAVIREGGDVLDFLDSQVVSRITSASAKRNKRASESDDFTVDDEGRMMIAEEEEKAGNNDMDVNEVTETVEDLYLESIKGEGAFTRLPDGRIKFLNKRKREEKDDEGGIGSGMWNRLGSKGKSTAEAAAEKAARDKMLGKQYKSKKAQGDLKRPGMPDPYAYIPLSGKIVGNMRKSAKLNNPELKEVIRTGTKGAHNDDARPNKKHKNVGVKKGNKKHK